MASLRPIVETLWQNLGLAPPLEEIGQEFSFEIGETPVTLRLEPNGDTVTLRGELGLLDKNLHQAADQLQRLLRIGLGLTALNRAVLDARAAQLMLAEDTCQPVPVYAVAKASLSDPSSCMGALQDVVDWQGYSSNILMREHGVPGDTAPPASASSLMPEEDFIIFQP